jgi:hypothetical protein
MLPKDVLIHASEYLTMGEYCNWRQTHRYARCVCIEPTLLYRHTKKIFQNKKRRFISKWCADIECMNKVCSCIDIITPKTVMLSVYCSKHSVQYLHLNKSCDLLL